MFIRNFITLLRRYTVSSLLNIIGMAVAFAAIYLILVQVKFDFSYNRVLPNSERIYRMEYPSWYKEGECGHTWSRSFGDRLCKDIPEIEAAGSCCVWGEPIGNYSVKRNRTIENYTLELQHAEREGLEVFPFEFIEGNLNLFITTDAVILSESIARKYNLSVGDILHAGGESDSEQQYTIVGIFKDFPTPSSISMSDGWLCMKPQEQANPGNWNDPYYVRLQEGISPQEVEKKLHECVKREIEKEGFTGADLEQLKRLSPRLNPITELYFATDTAPEGYAGNRSTTYTLIAIATLILIISYINFINFFFALIPSRMRAVNTYKIFGVPTPTLRLNFIFETVGLTIISLLTAGVFVYTFAATPLSEYISTSVSFAENGMLTGAMAMGTIIFASLVSLYPSWYITGINPAAVVNGGFQSSQSGRRMRHILVGVQYTISIALIICTLFVQRQHNFMLSKELGFDRELLLTVDVPHEVFTIKGETMFGGMSYDRRDAFSDKIKQNPLIADIAYGSGWIVNTNRMGWGRPVNGENINFPVYPVSWNFLDMMGIEIEEGRNFTPADEKSVDGVFIFNREAANRYGITTEHRITAHLNGRTAEVAGICKNFNFQPMQYSIDPFSFFVFGKHPWYYPQHAYIRTVAGADAGAVNEHVRKTIAEFAPTANTELYEVKFFDREIEILYQKEDKLSTLITLFSLLSIFISVIGVFGLVLFETQYRRREIGIRRVHGASVTAILSMFNRHYLGIVIVCSTIAIPASYIIINRWIEQYAYRIELEWWVYALAILIVTVVTILTVTLQSWSTANENPSDAIKK